MVNQKKDYTREQFNVVPVLKYGESLQQFMKRVNVICQTISADYIKNHPVTAAKIWTN